MARRRPSRPGTAAPVVLERPEVGARIAWAYLAVLLAGLVAGLLVVIGTAVFPALCRANPDPGACVLGGSLATALLGLLLALGPIGRALKLGWYFWLAYLIGYAVLVILADFGAWWWWAGMAVLPAAAAAASARYAHGRLHPVQRLLILLLSGVAVAALVWWYAFGQ